MSSCSSSSFVHCIIPDVGVSIGTAKMLKDNTLLQAYSCEFQIFFTLFSYSAVTLSLFSTSNPVSSSWPRYL